MKTICLAALVCAALSANAQPFSMGRMPDHGSVIKAPNPVITLIDLSHPATASATVTAASVRYNLPPAGSCANAFKVKFLRPNSGLTSYVVLAERGPFNATAQVTDVPISPGVAVQAGDLLAVTQLVPSTCGGVLLTNDDAASLMFHTFADITSGTFTNMTLDHGLTLDARAVATSNDIAGILTAAAAAQGVGAFFRTAVQLANPEDGTMTGKLVFHPQGVSAAAGDKSLTYSIGPHGTYSQNDLVTAMGATGLGSVDLITATGGVPLVIARVFNDRGTDGTDGFIEPLMKVTDAMSNGASGAIVLPPDLTNFRVNVGVRTLDAGATLTFYYTSPNDAVVATPGRSFDPNYFMQFPIDQLISSKAYKPNGHVGIQVTSGAAIIYVSIIDAKTGDSSVYFLGRP
jgi:hypothetical protein